jgi:hypothetical protein
MKRKKVTYDFFQQVSAICMILALAWLTISAPFVYAAQQELAKNHKCSEKASAMAGCEEETSNFGNNTTEEKSPNSSNSVSEEYLHDLHKAEHFLAMIAQYYNCEDADTYVAYHGELLVPPPNSI